MNDRFNPRFSRRALLGGLGAAAVASPFIPLLNASGGEPAPVRMVHIYFPHGTWLPFWTPAGTGSTFTLSPILSPLERHREKLLVLSGVDIADIGIGSDHHIEGPVLLGTCQPLSEDPIFFRDYPDDSGMPDYFYGWNRGPSFDQVMAERLGTTLPYRSLELGVHSENPHPGKRISYADRASPMPILDDPQAAFASLFASMSGPELDRALAARMSVFDLVGDELGRMQTRAPSMDRPKIEAHLTALRDLERGLTLGGAACTGPVLGAPASHTSNDHVPIIFNQQLEIMAAALACDLTRVMTLQFSRGSNDGIVYRWPEVGVTREEHHLISHEQTAGAQDDMRKIYTWYMDRLAYFCDLLAAIPEGDGTVLDNTVILVSSEIGTGWNHRYENVPFLLLGGAGGYLRPGRHLQCGGAEHNRLVVSLFHAMGMTDITSFGADPGTGPLPGLT